MGIEWKELKLTNTLKIIKDTTRLMKEYWIRWRGKNRWKHTEEREIVWIKKRTKLNDWMSRKKIDLIIIKKEM